MAKRTWQDRVFTDYGQMWQYLLYKHPTLSEDELRRIHRRWKSIGKSLRRFPA